jgi:hypothetical protein
MDDGVLDQYMSDAKLLCPCALGMLLCVMICLIGMSPALFRQIPLTIPAEKA